MNKNKTTNILLITLILIIGIGIIIYILPNQTTTQDKTITLAQVIKDVNEQEKTKYTYNQVIFLNTSNDATLTHPITNKIWIICFFNKQDLNTYRYIDNNHKITKLN